MRLGFLLIALLVLAQPAAAQPVTGTTRAGTIVSDPVCFNIINKAPYAVFGFLMTDLYTTPDGGQAHHRSNLRLEPEEKAEFCTYGPFFEGGKLELTLRTFVPIFSCRTALTGDIVIHGRRKDEGGTETWAECL